MQDGAAAHLRLLPRRAPRPPLDLARLSRWRGIALKVDVDTLRGTREGVPRLLALLKRVGAGATFFFSLGPDHTGRAMLRVFRPAS